MRRHANLIIMLVAELAVAAVAVVFHAGARASVLAAFREFDTPMTTATAVALAPWFLPAALGVAAAITAVAIAVPMRRSKRALVAGMGLVVASTALIFAVWAAFMALFHAS